ncbi:MAG: glycosyltransferase, partial [Thiogranum sp.]|nr:glycosyltransferase [Thiogranum sp.]
MTALTAGKNQRLAFLLPDLDGGGVQKNTLTIARGMAALGFDIDLLLCSETGALLSQVPEHFNIIGLQQDRQWTARRKALTAGNTYWSALLQPVLLAPKPSKTLRYLPALSEYLRTVQPVALLSAIVHLNIEAVLAKAMSGARTRIIVTQSHQFSTWHGLSGEWRRRHIRNLARKAYLAADGIIAVSQGVATDLVEFLDIPDERVEVIYNPVVTPELLEGRALPVDHLWFGEGEAPVILSVGRLGRQKDFATLVRAFAQVREQIPSRLLIVGEACDSGKNDQRRRALLALAEELGVSDYLGFQGFVHNPYAYMANAAVFVLSSHYEGFGNVLAEAL